MRLNQSRQNNPFNKAQSKIRILEIKKSQRTEEDNNCLTGTKINVHQQLCIENTKGMFQHEQQTSQAQQNQVTNSKFNFRARQIAQKNNNQLQQYQQQSNIQIQFNSPKQMTKSETERPRINKNMLPNYEFQEHQHSNYQEVKKFFSPQRQNQIIVQGLDQTKNTNYNQSLGQYQHRHKIQVKSQDSLNQFTSHHFHQQQQEQSNLQEQHYKNFYQPETNYINQQNNKPLSLNIQISQQQQQQRINQNQISPKQNKQQYLNNEEKDIQAPENLQIYNHSNQKQLEEVSRGPKMLEKRIQNSLPIQSNNRKIKFISHSNLIFNDNKQQFEMNRLKSDNFDKNTYDQEDSLLQTVFQTVAQICFYCQLQTKQFMINLNCRHQFHLECLLQHINYSLSKFLKNQQLSCLCGMKISSKILRANFPDQMTILMNLQVQVLFSNYQNQMFKCEKCSFVCIKDIWKKKQTFCDNCQTMKFFT